MTPLPTSGVPENDCPRKFLRRSPIRGMVALVAVLIAGLVAASATAAPGPAAAGERVLPAQRYVTTISGPGHAGVYAWGAATAKDGTILIGDYWNYAVRRYSPQGELLQTIGSRGGGPGQNQAPHGVAVDANSGDIYVADPNNGDSIDRFDAAGNFLGSFSIAPTGGVSNVYVTHIAVGPDGLVYATNSHNIPTTHAQVMVFAPDGTLVRVFGEQGKADGQIALLRGISVSSAGEVFLADAGQQRINVFTSEGVYLRSFGAGRFRGDMRGSAIDPVGGYYYATDAGTSEVEKFTLDGTWVATLGSEGNGPGQFTDGGRELAVGLDGTLYAPDFGGHRVNVYGADGTVGGVFPDPPQDPAPDGLNRPQGLALDASGRNLYIADTFNHRVSRFAATTGAFVGNWGFRGSTAPMAMNYPRDVAVDPGTGDVWLMNSRQSQVKHYRADGTFVRAWGRIGQDPGGLSVPRGIVAQGGRVYVVDGPIARVSIFDRLGTFQGMFGCGVYDPGMMSGCNGMVIAPNGLMYATCTKESVICVFNADGVLLRKIGQGKLQRPYDLALYKGRLYVTSANRVDVLTLSGAKLGSFNTVPGTGVHRIGQPRGIAISRTGRMYVLDSTNEHVDVFQILT